MTVTLNSTSFISMKDVKIDDLFWNQYVSLIKDVVVPYQWDVLNDRIEGAEKSHAVQNFKIAAGLAEGDFYGFIFQDTDVAKWLEAVGYLLMKEANPQLEAIADEMIDIIEKAQLADGYLNTYYTIKEPTKRWTNLTEAHELYVAGHMIEAAVSYYKATGKRKLLDIVCKMADYIDSIFGFAEGKIQGFDGHQEIELALVKLYHATGVKRYLELSKFFIDVRGTNNFFTDEAERRNWTSIWHSGKIKIDKAYFQAHLPVREQTIAKGHAVRVVYMLSGMIDIAKETNDEQLIQASVALWNNIVAKQMYITGGIGATVHGEAFTFDYDLPNDTVYAETCASIGLIFAGKRMLELDAKGHFGDIMERALYNTVLAGMALDGKHFFYVNPLEVNPSQCHGHNPNYNHVKPTRPEWYGCACCPPNLARLLASLGDYLYSVQGNTIYSHLFIGNTSTFEYENQSIEIIQHSDFTWNGKVSYSLKHTAGKEITLAVRNPSWSKQTRVSINGVPMHEVKPSEDGFIYISRAWQDQDLLEINFDMTIQKLRANPNIRANAGKVALQRGPLVYCLEQADNGDMLHLVSLPQDSTFATKINDDLLGGIVTIETSGQKVSKENWHLDALYSDQFKPSKTNCSLTFIPYYSWANRGEGEMMVWVKENE